MINPTRLEGTLRVSAPISPYSADDVYPTHLAEFGRGGIRTTDTLDSRDAVPNERREEGMVVFVQSEKKFFCLRGGTTNLHWVDLNVALQGDDTHRLTISQAEPPNPKPGDVWMDLSSGVVFIRDPDDRLWLPATSRSVDGGEF